MTARLRVLPVYSGERGQHYLVLDCTERGELTNTMAEALNTAAERKGAKGLAFNFPVDLPDVDEPEAAACSECASDAGHNAESAAVASVCSPRDHAKAAETPTGWTIGFRTDADLAEVGAKVLESLRDSPDLFVRRI